jgi:oxaloacetate decarboxylase (Na+ extruding) subunit alpha
VIKVRDEVGSPPLAAPIGQIVASQALINVLTANRYSTMVDELRELVAGRFGRTPGPIAAGLRRAVELRTEESALAEEEPVELSEIRAEAVGLASSEEELLLLALFGEEAEALLRSIRERSGGDESLAARGVDRARAEKIRELVRIVQETGIGEITIEEDGMRVSVRRQAEQGAIPIVAAPPSPADTVPGAVAPHDDALVRVESPMVGTFYRAPTPDATPFVQEGDVVAPGQTLCILEAMKLMNEVKAEIEAVVRAIHVGNAEPVEYGQLLFELEPVAGPPVL